MGMLLSHLTIQTRRTTTSTFINGRHPVSQAIDPGETWTLTIANTIRVVQLVVEDGRSKTVNTDSDSVTVDFHCDYDDPAHGFHMHGEIAINRQPSGTLIVRYRICRALPTLAHYLVSERG